MKYTLSYSKKLFLFFVLFLFLILTLVLFHNKLIENYFSYKLSKWVERKVILKNFKYKYPDIISISNLRILNKNPIYFKDIFYADKIEINFDLKSFLFEDLIIIYKLKINKPEFFLEVLLKNKPELKLNKTSPVTGVEDNIGLAKKINEKTPDKIWPQKNRDINFLIMDSELVKGKAFIKISSIKESSRINLSTFKFYKIGNHYDYKHYKKALELMLFDIIARLDNVEKKKILKKIYKL